MRLHGMESRPFALRDVAQDTRRSIMANKIARLAGIKPTATMARTLDLVLQAARISINLVSNPCITIRACDVHTNLPIGDMEH